MEVNESLQFQNISDSSLTEYDKDDLKSENVWICTECSYTTKNKNHVSEHVEKHIKGFSFVYNYCYRTMSMKRQLRAHKYSCKRRNNSE